jgi:hypothetical protein
LYRQKKELFDQGEKKLEESKWRRDNYFDIMMSMNETAIRDTNDFIEKR